MPISKPIRITRDKLKKISLDDIKRGERPLTRELMKEIRNLSSPFEFKENPEITSDSDVSDESYVDGDEILVRKQQMEECMIKCITFYSLSTTNNFKHLYNELKLQDIDDEIIREYFNGICNKKYEELNKQYDIEKTERLQEQIKKYKDRDYGSSFSCHSLIVIIFGFLVYLMFNHNVSSE